MINADGKYVRDYVSVEDVARANLLALNSKCEGFRAYNMGTGRGSDVNELESATRAALRKLLSAYGSGVDLSPPKHGPPRPGDLRSSILNCSKARMELGWVASVSLEEGLRRTAAWFVSHRESSASTGML